MIEGFLICKHRHKHWSANSGQQEKMVQRTNKTNQTTGRNFENRLEPENPPIHCHSRSRQRKSRKCGNSWKFRQSFDSKKWEHNALRFFCNFLWFTTSKFTHNKPGTHRSTPWKTIDIALLDAQKYYRGLTSVAILHWKSLKQMVQGKSCRKPLKPWSPE